MPGLAQCNKLNSKKGVETIYGNGSDSAFWSNDVTYNHLQKFWVELPTQARQELLRIDKQTLIEQARKNMYCSRCNGLLLEIFVQIVMYGKSLPQEGQKGNLPYIRKGTLKSKNDNDLDMKKLCKNGVEDPSMHLWGGLKTTIDGILTLLDCYLCAKSLKGLQIVFDSARARERERKLLYPDACGGGGRGWTSHGIYGRGHGTREACALHTARLSVDTLVDFWSALGEESRLSLLKMKEDDFIERLMYRFDSKRFCRDCRRNVIREFKELKELKRMQMEPRCTSWFCVADTAFLYEVSHDSVMADWHETFADNIRKYHHFEWGVGTGEGKLDILEFEDVGMRGRVQLSGLDLGGLSTCYITLRAWKINGNCSEYSVKAHALKGKQCVHCKLVVGDTDGCVTINNRRESIQSFFEHAEEAEEEEDDDSINNDGNDLDGECSRPQKHAKTPELAREFLLNAATVIFKEQVEKAFREGTARQNAHSIFVSLALNLLEERVHVACKEIITLEKQTKLLEEEEKEKCEEEERKERKRTKEREKKLRRKERLRVKDKKSSVSSESPNVLDDGDDEEDISPSSCEKIIVVNDLDIESSKIEDKHVLDDFIVSEMKKSHLEECRDGEFTKLNNDDISYSDDQLETKCRKECWSEASELSVVCQTRYDGFEAYSQSSSGWEKKSHSNQTKSNIKQNGSRCGERFHFTTKRMSEKNDFNSCSSCNRHSDYRVKPQDVSKQYYRVNKYNNQMDYANEKPKSKVTTGNNIFINKNSPHIKKVWEPTVKKCPQSNSDDTNVISQSSTFNSKNCVADKIKLCVAISSEELSGPVGEIGHKENNLKAHKENNCVADTVDGNTKACEITTSYLSEFKVKPTSVSSGSDNCSSCFSEGDSNTNNSSKETSESEEDNSSKECEVVKIRKEPEYSPGKVTLSNDILPTRPAHNMENMQPNVSINSQNPSMVFSGHNSSNPFPMHQAPSSAMGYYQQSLVSWGLPAHTNGILPAHTNGILPFYPQSHYVFPRPFEYGIQYGTHQHPTPLVNPGQGSTYQPVVRTNEINSKDQTVTPKTCGVLESFGGVSTERTVPMPNGNSKKPHGINSGFSLFHFGSPVALPAEYELNTTVPRNNKKEPVEEYNLFATSNSMRFPFF